jgi:hypothetical protein
LITKGFAGLAERLAPRIAHSGPPVPGCGWTKGPFPEVDLGRKGGLNFLSASTRNDDIRAAMAYGAEAARERIIAVPTERVA